MRGWTLLLVSFLIPALLLCRPALAQDKTDDDLAKQYYKLGEELYNRSDYEGALKQFQQAYKYSKRPAFVYNMARCYEFMGQLKQAVKQYEKFLESKPANAAVIQSRIANLKKRQEPTRPTPPTPTPATQPTAVKPPPTVTKPLPPRPPPSKPAPPPPQRERSRWKRTTGWVLVGVGVASLGASIVLGVMAGKKKTELEDASTKQPPEKWSDWRDQEALGKQLQGGQILTLGIGALAAVGGGVLVYLDMREEKQSRRASISPTLTRGGALVTGTWRF